MQAKVEKAKQSLYRAQQELLAQGEAAEKRERERSAELAADEADRRAKSVQEAAEMQARRLEIEQKARKACVLISGASKLGCTLHCKLFILVFSCICVMLMWKNTVYGLEHLGMND